MPNELTSSRQTFRLVSVLCCAIGTSTFAADEKSTTTPLILNEPVAREIALESSHPYTVQLNAGDYAMGWVDQRGITVFVELFSPNGSLRRGFQGRHEGKRDFAFVADESGTYQLRLRTPTADEASRSGQPLFFWNLPPQPASGRYELRLTERLSVDERLKPAPYAEKYLSPTIASLRQQIAQGETNTEIFWSRVARSGAPLVEPAENDPGKVLLTFLWRGKPETRNVVVLSSFEARSVPDNVMKHLAGSDVWFLTVRLPNSSRFTYTLSHNDPLTGDGPTARQRNATAQADPLNPRQYMGAGAPGTQRSLVVLPNAPSQPWIVRNPDTPTGTVKDHQISSGLLKNERKISVYIPAGYQSNGVPCALLVLFDKGAYLHENLIPTPVVLDNLIAASKIPLTVAVFIPSGTAPSGQSLRDEELTPNQDFADFLAKELIPWVRNNYNVTTDSRQTVVGGSSLGGLAAAYAALRHSEIFGNVLSQSGSFWWTPVRQPYAESTREPGRLARLFLDAPKRPIKFHLDAGLFEADWGGGGGYNLETTRHMRDVLRAKGYEVHYQEFAGGHEYINWRGTLSDGLTALIGKSEG